MMPMSNESQDPRPPVVSVRDRIMIETVLDHGPQATAEIARSLRRSPAETSACLFHLAEVGIVRRVRLVGQYCWVLVGDVEADVMAPVGAAEEAAREPGPDPDAVRKHALLKALADGPLSSGRLRERATISSDSVTRRLLQELFDARQVRRIGRSRHTQWALIGWTAPAETEKPAKRKAAAGPSTDRRPQTAWWADPDAQASRSVFRRKAAEALRRMQGDGVRGGDE